MSSTSPLEKSLTRLNEVPRLATNIVNSSSPGVISPIAKSQYLVFDMNRITTESVGEEIILNSNEIRTKTIQLVCIPSSEPFL